MEKSKTQKQNLINGVILGNVCNVSFSKILRQREHFCRMKYETDKYILTADAFYRIVYSTLNNRKSLSKYMISPMKSRGQKCQ